METAKAPPPPRTKAPVPLLIDASGKSGDRPLEGAASSSNFTEARRGGGTRGGGSSLEAESAHGQVRPALDMRWEVEGAAAPQTRRGGTPTSETCAACGQAQRSHGLSPGAAAGVAKDAHGGDGSASNQITIDDLLHHTCGRTEAASASSPCTSLTTPCGMDRTPCAAAAAAAAATVPVFPQDQQLATTGLLSGEQHDGELTTPATPVTVAGVGASLGAEHDATPLHCRPPRPGVKSSRFGVNPLAGGSGGTGGGAGTTSNRSPPAGGDASPGLESGSNSDGRGLAGGGLLKRKDTITWEAFLANITVGDAEEEGGVRSASDSSSPYDRRLREGTMGHARRVTSMDTSIRSRYLRAMTSNAGSLPWNNGGGGSSDGDEGGEENGGGSDGTDNPALPETVVEEGEEETVAATSTSSNMPRMLSDLSDRTLSSLPAHHLDMGRSRSFSAAGVVPVYNVQKTMRKGINKFNVNPKDGIAFLVEEGLLDDSAEGICGFLCSAEGLSKRRVGEYFGRDNAKAQDVLGLFLKNLNFKDKTLDEALRSMVLKFRLPGEAQQMDRIIERFSERYHEENAGVFSSAGTAWVLAFGLMILNTDMYNRNIKESAKMTEAQFVKNHRGVDQGLDPPKELLEGMYRRVKESEIRMDEGDMYESEVITFVAPKKSGWLKKKGKGYVGKWKKHWFVLNDAVLYYFRAPQYQDEAPRCIIPLEGINVDPIGTTDVSISLRANQGYVKSVKMMDNGSMEQGHHRSFVLRAESQSERDGWVHALRAEVPAFQMELTSSRSLSATPATSSAATPIGTPSESRRSSKFGAVVRADRKRRSSPDARSTMPPPVIRGWARTQSDQHQTGGRRYIALFRSVGPDLEDVVFFFGDAAMCDKMIGQRLRTSHGCLPLSDVTRVQLRQEDGSGGGRAIALQTGMGKGLKEMVIVPEEQREFLSWTRHIKECCPDSAYTIAADGTPTTNSVGDTAFPSVNTVDSSVDGCSTSPSAIAIGRTIAGIQGDIFVAVAPSTTTAESCTADGTSSDAAAAADAGRKGRSGSDAAYVRTESGGTQPPLPPVSREGFACAGGAGGGNGSGGRETARAVTTPSSATEPDSRVETGVSPPPPLQRPKSGPKGEPRSPRGPTPRCPKSPRSQKAAGIARSSTVTARTREDSTPGTDVE